MSQRYVLGQGMVYLDEINPQTLLPLGKARFVGNVPTGGFTISPSVQKIEHQESYTGRNLTDLVIERQQKTMGMIRLENINKENLMVSLYGSSESPASGTITAELHTAYRGSSFFLNRMNVTSITSIATTAQTPVTLVADTDYIVDLKSGTITILPGSTAVTTQGTEVSVTYVAGTSEIVKAFSSVNKELWLRFNGVNNADGNKPIIFEAFKVRLQPAKSIELINEQVTNLEVDFECLYQAGLDTVAGYEGGFFRVMQNVAA